MRLAKLMLAFLLAGATTALAQQFPPQPAAPQMGSEAEQDACQPDVVKFCQAELSTNPDDVSAILACQQRNRTRISEQCQQVLAENAGTVGATDTPAH